MFKRSQGPTATEATLKAFGSPTAEVLAEHHPFTERAALITVSLMLLAILAFISVVQVDRIVSATGRLVPVGGTITVQPLETQILRHIEVQVGDVVHKGQVLAVCDPTLSEADRQKLAGQVASLEAQVARLSAEEAGPRVRTGTGAYDALQQRLYQQRQTELTASLQDYDQRIRATETQIAGLQTNIDALVARQKISGELAGMHDKLAKEGYVSRLQQLGVQDQQIALNSQLADARSTLDANQHQLSSLREQRKVFLDHWHSGNLTDLLSARTALDQARQDLTKATMLRDLVNVVAPVDGVVTRIPQLSAGGIAGSSAPLFGLVPLDTPLEAAVQIEPIDIGFVKVGQPVNLKFDAYKFMEHGIGHGSVKAFSQDSFSSDSGSTLGSGTGISGASGGAHFDARVQLTQLDLHNLPEGKARLLPGMTVQADIVVGRRTILWYLLSGALRSGAEALHEP